MTNWGGIATNIEIGDNPAKNTYTNGAAPTVNSDSNSSFSPGSVWVDLTNDKAYMCVDATPTAAVWIEITAGGGGGAGGAWELVERKAIAVAVQDADFTGLDGDTDEQYLLTGMIRSNAAADCLYYFNIPGAGPTARGLVSNSGGVATTTSAAFLSLNVPTTDKSTGEFACNYFADRGAGGNSNHRLCRWESFSSDEAASSEEYRSGGSKLDIGVVTGNVTTLRVAADQASGIGIGSILNLYKSVKA